MSLQNIGPLPRYSGHLEPLSQDVPGRIPSAAGTAQEGILVPLEPIVEVGMMQPVFQTIVNRSPGPLEAMTMSSSAPSSVGFELPRQGQAYNDLLERLMSHGYLVKYRLYDGQALLYLLTQTRAGDIFLIRLDLPQSRPGLSRVPEIQMERRPVLTVVPQEIKIGALQCLNYDICGAAFICEGDLCLAERPNNGIGDQVKVVEEQFALKSLIGLQLGKSIVAYPVVQLSDLLADLDGYEIRIAEASRAMADLGYEIVSQDAQNFLRTLDELRVKVTSLTRISKDLRSDLDRQIEELTHLYSRVRDLHPSDLPDDQQARYYMLLKTLTDKKAKRRRFIDAIANAYRNSELVQPISNEIDSQLDPILKSIRAPSGNQ